jgi:ABC-type bacteriocin/lantibiotic exporter with double-glycine peptidase domain
MSTLGLHTSLGGCLVCYLAMKGNFGLILATLRILDVIIVSTTLYLILTQDGMTGAAAGFMLVFARDITYLVNVILFNIRQLELNGVSLERTSEYRLLPREDGEVLNPNEPRAFDSIQEGFTVDTQGEWPSKGAVKVEDLRVRYGPDMPEILHDVSFEIEGGQRVGIVGEYRGTADRQLLIVGATGGGKSTLAKAFFAFVDATHGKIEIDGRGAYCLIMHYKLRSQAHPRPRPDPFGPSPLQSRYHCARPDSALWLTPS